MREIKVFSWRGDRGGAGLAANRHYEAMLSVSIKHVDFITVATDNILFRIIEEAFSFPFRLVNGVKSSLNILPGRLDKVVRDNDINIIHWVNNNTLSLYRISRVNGPLYVYLHDYWWLQDLAHYPNDINNIRIRGILQKWKYSILTKDNIKIIVPSERMKDVLGHQLGLNSYVIPNPIDLGMFNLLNLREKEDKMSVLLVVPDKKNRVKGYEELSVTLEGLATDRDLIDSISFKIIGQRKDWRVLKNYQCTFITPQDTEGMSMLYNKVDVVIIPSIMETFGQVAFEALSCGCRVIVRQETPMADFVKTNGGGIVIDDFSRTNLKGAILSLQNSELNQVQIRKIITNNFGYEKVGFLWQEILTLD